MPVTADHLAGVKTFEDLARLFHDQLAWPAAQWPTFPGVAALYGIDQADIPGVVSLAAVQKLDESQPWGVFLVDFGDNAMSRSALRGVLAKVAQRARQVHDNPVWPHEDILFVVRHSGTAFSFGHFRGEKLANAKLKRFGWSDPLESRTAVENLDKLNWGSDWAEAWNVEKLTKDFFTKLSGLFYDTSDALATKIKDENERRLFVQTLFNRLVFLRFVEKKGDPGNRWLNFNDRPDYLRALWEAGQDGVTPFWPTRLHALFRAVNNEVDHEAHKVAKPIIGDVPYLNGGLFEDDPRFVDPTIQVPEQVFKELLGPEGLFYKYNFTVEESSPLDVQVAVDPEILGKIFEQLTISSRRHDTGSYYTPREIVQFMCREALVGYLGSKGIDEGKAHKLVYDHDTGELTNNEGDLAFDSLKVVKVVDPACGSGAYLLGMLQELYALYAILQRQDRRFSADPAREEHERKLHIIENNIYGVDLQAFATNTAMLRLWLTLLVEDTGARPQPLPNLEYKIEAGDALLGPDPSQPIDWSSQQRKKGKAEAQAGLDVWSREDTVKELRDLRLQYQEAHGPAKAKIKSAVETRLAELREKVTGSPKKETAKFDWRVEFFDVFLDEPSRRSPGFDVVLANPPYVRHELISDLKPGLRAVYGDFYCGTADLYTYFYARAVQLLRPDGMFAFISSNKWFRAAYGENLRAFMAENTSIRSIIDFRDLPVFVNAAAYAMVFIAQKQRCSEQTPVYSEPLDLSPPYPDIRALVKQVGFPLPPDAIQGSYWTLADADTLRRLRQMVAVSVPLGQYVDGRIYYGIKTGFNDAFVIDGAKRAELIAEDPRSTEIIKPLAVGRDIRRWAVEDNDRWVIVTHVGVDIDGYPAVFKHLKRWQNQLIRRQDQGNHWWELRACAYYGEFESPRILFPDIASQARFAYARPGVFINDTSFMIVLDDLYLVGVANSAPFLGLVHRQVPQIQNGFYRFKPAYLVRLPIPRASQDDRDAVATLVQECLDAKAADPDADVSALEAEIDARVEFLYFHQHEAPTYDEWLAKRQAEQGTVIEEVRRLVAGGENDRVEFKETLEAGGTTPEHKAAVFTASLRAICSFINRDGGTLLIGVHDTNGIVGLAKDCAIDAVGQDRFQQKLATALRHRAVHYTPGLVTVGFVSVDGHCVAKVDVKSTKGAKVLLDGKLYVRDLTTTVELDPTTMAYLANAEADPD